MTQEGPAASFSSVWKPAGRHHGGEGRCGRSRGSGARLRPADARPSVPASVRSRRGTSRAKWRGLRHARAASASTGSGLCKFSLIQAKRSPRRVDGPVCAVSASLNCFWSPGRRRNNTSSRATARASAVPVIRLDEGKREIHARRDPRRRPDRPVADVDRFGIDRQLGMEPREFGAPAPMRRHEPTLQHPSGGQNKGAGAHADDAAGARGAT